jgi:lysophospholipase L1-like esterase
MNTGSKSFPRRRFRLLRGLMYRMAAVLLGLAPFVVAEGVFTLFDWGRADYSVDPFVGFRGMRPLFVPSDDGARFEIAESRQAFFRPDSFAREKGPNEFRIFCLGGSTVQGRPFAIETSFTTWLELSLRTAQPTRTWDVVNCGGVSYASYRLVPILEEVLQYKPDLVILYTGHNEFLEDRTYGHIKRIPEVVAAPSNLLMQTRTLTLLRGGYLRLRGQPPHAPDRLPVLLTEVDAMLDYRGGLKNYHRDENWRRNTIDHFRYNLRRMVRLADEAGVPLLLVNPVSKLRGCPPFKSQHRDGLTAEQLQQWEMLVDQAEECHGEDPHRSVSLLRQALKIDDQHAGLHHLLASCCDMLGMTDQARKHYVLAKEMDVCPLRMLEPMHDAVLDVARERGVPFVDVRCRIESLSRDHIPDDRYLLDHVHPSIEGHKLIAQWLMDDLIRQGVVKPVDGWKDAREQAFRKHFESLDALYFFKGAQQLESLRRWTQGKASGVRGKTPATRLD